ncbi:DNA-directed RNA polymerase subunit L [Candidatus Woesearchaeota archaeon]|nr:DNA-directed RNA polymerase subunit L [Candidatus Woesearchaeota archaeon]
MEITILNENKEMMEIEIEGEDHTLCNALRSELWNFEIDAAAYKIEHPLVSDPVLMVSGKNPRGKLVKASESLRKLFKSLKDDFNKKIK